jgi:major vault protein
MILGKTLSAEGKVQARPGQVFAENGMKIYDVEVLEVRLQNPEIEKMLVQSQRDVIQNTLTLANEKRKLLYIQESEEIKRTLAETNAETARQKLELEGEAAKHRLELDLQMIHAAAQTQAENLANQLAAQKGASDVASVELQRKVATRETDIALDQKAQEVKLKALTAEVAAIVEKAKAVSPDLIAALSSFGERAMIEKVSESMAPLAILGGGSVVDILKKLLEGTALAKQLEAPLSNGNGAKSKTLNA